MISDLAKRIRNYSQTQGLIFPCDHILVAVSGGPDSVALLLLLFELREELELQLEVAHLQHGIRGEEAKEDARFVAELAHGLGLPFHLKEIDLPEIISTAGKGNLEALARDERYRFFADVVAARGLTKVAVAHTQDDQAETLLMRFLRGAGMTGLSSMAPSQRMSSLADLTVIRPLLGVSKRELLDYLAEKHQTYRSDRTNQDTAMLRNWVRLELLPKIGERLDGRLNERLAQQAELLRDEDEALAQLARGKLAEVRDGESLRRQALLDEPQALQRRILRLWIESLRGNLRSLDFVHIKDMLQLIAHGAPHGRFALPGRWQLEIEYDRVKLVRLIGRRTRSCYTCDFVIGSSLALAEAGWTVESELLASPARLPADPMEAFFDAARLPPGLVIRNFRNGDFFQPLGMTGHKKIKELFMEKKLSLSARALWPLLAAPREVLWIPGHGRSEVAKITPGTTSILRLKLVSLRT
ncbi:MAG: tRNA lysidine(34) synthetase TilS [Deltaproteobacteria bacterium]|nr:tRNA lysidine(34) synthetase TilS [Deltaproteobacteria bacterium]